jgi:hypothetical protein
MHMATIKRISITSRATYAAIIAFVMVLPAAAGFDGFRLHSPAILFIGLFFLIGFGLSYYLLLRWFLDEEIADEIGGSAPYRQPVPVRVTSRDR